MAPLWMYFLVRGVAGVMGVKGVNTHEGEEWRKWTILTNEESVVAPCGMGYKLGEVPICRGGVELVWLLELQQRNSL